MTISCYFVDWFVIGFDGNRYYYYYYHHYYLKPTSAYSSKLIKASKLYWKSAQLVYIKEYKDP